MPFIFYATVPFLAHSYSIMPRLYVDSEYSTRAACIMHQKKSSISSLYACSGAPRPLFSVANEGRPEEGASTSDTKRLKWLLLALRVQADRMQISACIYIHAIKFKKLLSL